ncbi:MAG: hypothetical protein Q9159_002208 [Coniocarpon cinnabarinum]
MAPLSLLVSVLATLATKSIASPVASAAAAQPTLYLAGDSTMTPAGNADGTQGWGVPLVSDMTIPIVNNAIAGRSARSFTREGRFTAMAQNVKQGDYVIIEFGHNDGGSLTPTDNGGVAETVLTYEAYLVNAAKLFQSKGATVIISSATPNNVWETGTYTYSANRFVGYARDAAAATKSVFIDHGQSTADAYQKLGATTVDSFYPHDHTHTSPAGATVVAQAFVTALKAVGAASETADSNLEAGGVETISTRQAWRRRDDFTPGTLKLKLVTEALPLPLAPTAALIRVHAVSLNYRDANIANGGNPWPVIPHGIICNDAAGEVIAIGDKVKHFKIGDRVSPHVDSHYITDRSVGRSWLAANEDGVLANYIVSWALKLARVSGLNIILTSSSDEKLSKMQKLFGTPTIRTINYAKNPEWDVEALKMTGGIGVDLVVEHGGASSLVRSMRCTRRGGIVSQVGYLGKQHPEDLKDFVSTIIDRRIVLRGINAGSKFDMDDLCAALETTQMQLDDIIDKTYPFEHAEEAVQCLWEGKVLGKVVISPIQ